MNQKINRLNQHLFRCYNKLRDRSRIPVYFCFMLTFPVLKTGSVMVSWDANHEPDLAGYKIYYGLASRNYDHSVPVGNTTTFKISELEVGKRYYFVVTAVDFAGNESAFSEEVSVVISESSSGETEEQTQSLKPLVYNFPNPFKIPQEGTTIRYELDSASEITIKIYDVNNKIVTTLLDDVLKSRGEHSEDVWDGTNSNGEYVANGIYLCRIQSSNIQRYIKIAVTR